MMCPSCYCLNDANCRIASLRAGSFCAFTAARRLITRCDFCDVQPYTCFAKSACGIEMRLVRTCMQRMAKVLNRDDTASFWERGCAPDPGENPKGDQMVYSKGLVQDVLDFLDAGHSTREAQRRFDVHFTTAARWRRERDALCRTGSPQPVECLPGIVRMALGMAYGNHGFKLDQVACTEIVGYIQHY